MTRETFSCGDFQVPMAEITDLNIHGQKGIVFTANKQYYELRPAENCNALKFHLFYHTLKENT
jgi:hypothetical protein